MEKEKNRQPLNQQQEQIISFLQNLHFRPRLFGVDQQDVWKKIEQLNQMYEVALSQERARYDALLLERTQAANTVPHRKENGYETAET